MRRMSSAFMIVVGLYGCAVERSYTRPEEVRGVELSTMPAAPECRLIGAVEVRSGQKEPTTHAVLKAVAVARGANYAVLDAFGVIPENDDIVAVTRARLFECPLSLVCYRPF